MNILTPVYFTAAPLQERVGVEASLDRVAYAPNLEAPPERPFAFAYAITVRNDSASAVTLKGRKWVVTDADGCRHVTEGDGIAGRFPRLAPGQIFSFQGFHCVPGDSRAEGSILACDESGCPVLVRIPPLVLSVSP